MNTCEFFYIRRRDNLPIQAKGIEKSWPELQREFGHTGSGYPGAIYFKTTSSEGPELFAVVNNRWVLYHEGGKWHRYVTACDIKFQPIRENKFNAKQQMDEQEDESWVVVADKDCDMELVDY